MNELDRCDDRLIYEPTSFTDLVETLAVRAHALVDSGQRRLLGITGPPGSGKSTLSARLNDALGSAATVVGMDGFHLSNEELTRLSRRDRKGAPDTFDVGGYVAMLRRLRTQDADVIYAPRFEREIEQSIGSAVPIERATPLIITEGNYLLVGDGGWENVRDVLDEVWYLDVPDDVRANRLIERQRRHGKSLEDARHWTEEVDLPNGRFLEGARRSADLIVIVPETESPEYTRKENS